MEYVIRPRKGTRIEDWHEQVYRTQNSKPLDKVLRARVLKRDGYRCQVLGCQKKRGLEAHHIIPRPEGPDEEENLITLCRKHHDVVELAGIRTRAQIVNFSEEDVVESVSTQEKTEEDWRVWVYGGARNPHL